MFADFQGEIFISFKKIFLQKNFLVNFLVKDNLIILLSFLINFKTTKGYYGFFFDSSRQIFGTTLLTIQDGDNEVFISLNQYSKCCGRHDALNQKSYLNFASNIKQVWVNQLDFTPPDIVKKTNQLTFILSEIIRKRMAFWWFQGNRIKLFRLNSLYVTSKTLRRFPKGFNLESTICRKIRFPEFQGLLNLEIFRKFIFTTDDDLRLVDMVNIFRINGMLCWVWLRKRHIQLEKYTNIVTCFLGIKELLNHFKPVFPFYTPWKLAKPLDFFFFLGGGGGYKKDIDLKWIKWIIACTSKVLNILFYNFESHALELEISAVFLLGPRFTKFFSFHIVTWNDRSLYVGIR